MSEIRPMAADVCTESEALLRPHLPAVLELMGRHHCTLTGVAAEIDGRGVGVVVVTDFELYVLIRRVCEEYARSADVHSQKTH